jgi:tRNA-specific 2-thiouridylase
MSGGVDSTTCALLLREKYNVHGFFMHLAQPDFPVQKLRVEKIAEQLNIPLHIVDLRSQFETCVLEYFSSSYFDGLTPNPCIICNREIKFGLFLDAVLEKNMAYMATGHYARIKKDAEMFHLYKGIDSKKDQSYFLSRLTQSQLAKVLFPLGNMTKKETYNYVEQQGFNDFRGLESQDICFLENNGIGRFLSDRATLKTKNGPIISSKGLILGGHNGLFNYTIGQRKGLGISSDAPLYVTELDAANNAVIVGGNDELFCENIRIKELYWLAGVPPDLSSTYSVRIRYSHKGSEAAIHLLEESQAEIVFHTPQRAITPGQFAVIYNDTELLGSGVIAK